MSNEAQFTPGPWRWEVNLGAKQIDLCGGDDRYDLKVVDFVRYGMGGASPRFRENKPGWNIMHRADEHAVPVKGREHHEDWFRAIDHPDAHLIAAAPDLYAVVERLVRWFNTETPADCDDLSLLEDICLPAESALAKARGGGGA